MVNNSTNVYQTNYYFTPENRGTQIRPRHILI